LERP